MVLLRRGYAQFFRRVDVRFDNFVVLEMAEGFMSHDKPVMCVFCYIPPRDSPAYSQTDSRQGIEMIEHCLADLHEVTNDFYLFMCRDLNARTNQDNGKILSLNTRDFNARTNQDNGKILSLNTRISGDDDSFLNKASQRLVFKRIRFSFAKSLSCSELLD